MTIKDLWSKALGDIKKKHAVPFSEFKGITLGIDISVWLHKYCHTDIVALCLNSEPKYPPLELLAKLQSNHQQLTDANIRPYYVFDGFRHPMKKVARKQREKKYDAAKLWLEEFYDDARNNIPIDEERRESAMKYLREFTIPNELVISYIVDWMEGENVLYDCAPFEAEWQPCCV